ncbi:MAG: hypothetical protein IKN45_10835, partial [Lachnospiraceae bacterium]|nr:hypothetical protein [Lachnospiraceae bacterium]
PSFWLFGKNRNNKISGIDVKLMGQFNMGGMGGNDRDLSGCFDCCNCCCGTGKTKEITCLHNFSLCIGKKNEIISLLWII